jgi:3-methyladenine DNA glycosylase AlkD
VLAGPAWLAEAIDDRDVLASVRRDDRWWRHAALVATTVPNTKSRGGFGDTDRTLLICGELADDRHDMVVKAESWALRALAPWSPAAVVAFLERHDVRLTARVKREVGNKLRTGRKSG